MSKLLTFSSFIGLTFLSLGALAFPDSPIMWMAAVTSSYAYLRGALMLILFVLLITNPPRNKAFRAFVGFLAVGLAAWSLVSTYQNVMEPLDTASILAASISMGIVALEYKFEYEPDEEMLNTRGVPHTPIHGSPIH